MKKKILVCHNRSINNSSFDESFYQKFLEKQGEKRNFIFASDFEEFKKYTDNNIWEQFDAIMVLCELDWKEHRFSEIWGIELLWREIRLRRKINLPVLFFSFQDRTRIATNADNTKKICCRLDLGHIFITLPIAKPDEISSFDKMPTKFSESEYKPVLPSLKQAFKNLKSFFDVVDNKYHTSTLNDEFHRLLVKKENKNIDGSISQMRKILDIFKDNISDNINLLCNSSDDIYTQINLLTGIYEDTVLLRDDNRMTLDKTQEYIQKIRDIIYRLKKG